MKKLYALIIIFFLSVVGNSQIVNIPDAALKTALLSITTSDQLASNQTPIYISIVDDWEVTTYNSIDSNGDGEIQLSEAQQIKYLRIFNVNATNIIGLEAFTNLEYLQLSGTSSLQNLNLSNLTNLKFLDCNSNYGLNNLNVTGLNNLVKILCYQNFNLTELNISTLNSLETVQCSGNNLTSLNASQNQNLKYLDCRSNQLTSLNITGSINLETLNCNYNQLSVLNVTSVSNLKNLMCRDNQLINLNVSQNLLLEDLNCANNQLTNVTFVGLINLINLNCSNNLITNLNLNGAINLEVFECSTNQLTSLNLNSNSNLINLGCSNNLLTSINFSGLTNLNAIFCSQNFLTSLDISQIPNLGSLNCSNNQINSLNISQNPSLQFLYCSFNQLTTLDLSQNLALYSMNCNFNQLTTLDLSQNLALHTLHCENNQLTTLNVSQNQNLNRLFINNNLLNSLFVKNGYLDPYYYFQFNNNPNIEFICSDEIAVEQIQNLIDQYGYSATCSVNSYCSFNPGGTFYTINGNSKLDTNNNGCDTNDINFSNLKFALSDGTTSGTLISNASGNYSIPVSAGTHAFTPQLENPNYFIISPTNAMASFPATVSPFTQNFCISPNGIFHDLEVTIIPVNVAVPGFDATYKLKYKNKGNQIETAVLSFNYDDAVLDLVTTSVSPNSQNTGVLNWNLGTLNPFQEGEILVILNLNSPMETPPLNSGDILNYTATINGLNTEETPIDNTSILNQTVVNSFDPNDKHCLEGNTISPTMIGQYVHYIIRFENTGTFPAQNIVVKDVIDTSKFDVTTLQMTDASHNCYTRIKNNTVEFIFENINLDFADATNDGYLVFKIKTKSNLTVGSQIANKANIYFDYNFPIITNTETSTFQTLQNNSFEMNNYFTIYPIPAKDFLTISNKQDIAISSISIYNILGQIVLTSTNPSENIDVSYLIKGNYLIKLATEKGITTEKFLKE